MSVGEGISVEHQLERLVECMENDAEINSNELKVFSCKLSLWPFTCPSSVLCQVL